VKEKASFCKQNEAKILECWAMGGVADTDSGPAEAKVFAPFFSKKRSVSNALTPGVVISWLGRTLSLVQKRFDTMKKDQAARSANTQPRGKNRFRVLMTPEERMERVQKMFDTTNKAQAARSVNGRRRDKKPSGLMTSEELVKRTQQKLDTMNTDQNARSADIRGRGKRPFPVLMTPEERVTIERNAAAKGLSTSAYLRTLGLGYEPKSILDTEQVYGLLKLGGDLVRLGGLLKSWLNEQPGRGLPENDVRQLLAQIMETRTQIADKLMEMQV
jgi:hypothetical protein